MQMLCRFPDRDALLAACPASWLLPDADPAPPPEDGALVVLGVLWDRPQTEYDAEGRPLVPPTRRKGYHALLQLRGEPPEGFAAAQIAWRPGDPTIPGEDPPPPPPEPSVVPVEITRAQARVVMAAHILEDGRSLLRAMRELLAAQQEATAELPDADHRKIAATQAAEWWSAAATYRRDHQVLLMAAAELGIPDAVVDALFRAAYALKGAA